MLKTLNVTLKTLCVITILLGVSATVLGVSAKVVLAEDRINMNDTVILGTEELPKSLYIVPWKNSRPYSPFAGVSEGGSFDDALVALDRDVMQREVKYYDILYGSTDTPDK